jgi:hypothetical protein
MGMEFEESGFPRPEITLGAMNRGSRPRWGVESMNWPNLMKRVHSLIHPSLEITWYFGLPNWLSMGIGGTKGKNLHAQMRFAS